MAKLESDASKTVFEKKMLVKEVEACSFDKFYSNFKKVTFRSVLIPIPPDVLAYLRSDGSLVKESHHIASILNSFFCL